MANYVTQTSDKSREVALQKWKKGCFGVFGLENFYVGKIGRGIGHFAAGVLFCLIAISAVVTMMSGEIQRELPPEDVPIYLVSMVLTIVILWAFLAVPNLYRLKMGTFRDNIGAVLRE